MSVVCEGSATSVFGRSSFSLFVGPSAGMAKTAAPPTVTGLAALSPLRGEVQVGWKLEKVDGVDVSTMTGGEATRLLEERAANARHLEFDRTLAPLPNYNHGA